MGLLIGVLAALVALAIGPGALIYALTLAPRTAPMAATLASWLERGFPIQLFTLPLLSIAVLVPTAILVALPAAYLWGERRGGWLAFIQWLAVGVSATLGFVVYEFVRFFISAYFMFELEPHAAQLALMEITRQFNVAPIVVFTVMGALVGGALNDRRGSTSRVTDAQAGAAQARAAQRSARWGWWLAVGVLLVALGVAASLWLPASLVVADREPIRAPIIALLGLAALVPTVVILVALSAVFWRLGAGAGWRALGLAALSYAPLMLELVALALLQRLQDGVLFQVLLSDSPAALLFGVGLALATVFGADSPARWRGRAAAIGALLGLGYAGAYLILVIVQLRTPLGSCNGVGGCVLVVAFRTVTPSFWLQFALEGFALTLVGAMVGGWLRASAHQTATVYPATAANL